MTAMATSAADDLGGDERPGPRRRDPGEGVGEHPSDGDGGVGEAGRAREEVGGADVGADRGRGQPAPAGAGQGEDHEQEPEGGDHLGEEVGARGPVLGRDADRGPLNMRLATMAPPMQPATWAGR